MAFCQFSSETVFSNSTSVDNSFINDFLPYANATCVKVYLYGLYKASNASSYDNTLASFSTILGLSEEDIYSAFLYWQDQGLVQILNCEPFEVVYNPIKSAVSNTKKYKKEKYEDFNIQLETILKGKTITLNEYYQYYEFMEVYHVEPQALLLIIEYAIRYKGTTVGYNYVLTIAKAWANEGYTTYEKVDEKLQELEQNSSQIGELFKALSIKRVASIDEKEMLAKWQKEYEFDFATIVGICKMCKKQKIKVTNFEKLDAMLLKYYSMKLTSLKEIENYESEKKDLLIISKNICKNLGLYYENLEPVYSNYTQRWTSLGFNAEMLEKVALYCFKSSIRNLDGMNTIINKFYTLGITTPSALEEHLADILHTDEKIKQMLDDLGLVRNVNKFDRECYKIWTADWNMPEDIIALGIQKSKDKYSPMQHLSKLLSLWHSKGATTISACEQLDLPTINATKSEKKTQNYKNRDYSQTDLNALFDNLEEINL